MPRDEFSEATKAAAFLRAGGRCEIGRIPHMPSIGCGCKLMPGRFTYEHIIADYFEGGNAAENCAVLCDDCAGKKTAEYDRPAIDKSKRIVKRTRCWRYPECGCIIEGNGTCVRTIRRRDASQAQPVKRGGFQTNKGGPFKRKLRGGIERR